MSPDDDDDDEADDDEDWVWLVWLLLVLKQIACIMYAARNANKL